MSSFETTINLKQNNINFGKQILEKNYAVRQAQKR